MSRSHWRTERRTKVALSAADDTSTAAGDSVNDESTTAARRSHGGQEGYTRGSQAGADPRQDEEHADASLIAAIDDATRRYEAYEEEDEESDGDESRPGAYAMSRRARSIVSSVYSEDASSYDSPIPEVAVEEEGMLQEEHILNGEDDDIILVVEDLSPAPAKKNVSWWILYIIMIIGVSGVVIMTVLLVTKSGDLAATGGSKEEPVADTTTGTRCDLIKDLSLEDPFLQCACFNRIEMKDEDVRETYDRLLSSGHIANYLGSSKLESDSCEPDNIAAVWVATNATYVQQNGGVVETEDVSLRFALCALYASLKGQGWTSTSLWLSDNVVCEWHGVSCNEDGKVSLIDLSNNNLQGTLGSSIGLLYNLKILDLSDNWIGGPIPLTLWRLPTLEEVWLQSNYINGTLPTPLGEYSQSFQTISLSGNRQLGGRLPSLSGLSNLQELYIELTSFTGALFGPDAFADLGQLQIFEVLAVPTLTGVIPSEINLLTSLKRLIVVDTAIEGTIPESLGDMTSLERLLLGINDLSGTIPSSLGRLTNLVLLEMYYNNNLGGTLPPELGNMAALRSVDVGGLTKLVGTVPTTYANLSHLELMDIFDTGIEGPFPVGICDNGLSPEIVTGLDCPCCVKICAKRCFTEKVTGGLI